MSLLTKILGGVGLALVLAVAGYVWWLRGTVRDLKADLNESQAVIVELKAGVEEMKKDLTLLDGQFTVYREAMDNYVLSLEAIAKESDEIERVIHEEPKENREREVGPVITRVIDSIR